MISEEEVLKLATLARLEIEPSFVPVITGHVNSILQYVQQLDKVDTSAVAPMSHVHGANNVLREDRVICAGTNPEPLPLGDPEVPQQEMLQSGALLRNVPDHSGRFIRVPLIVE